MVTPLPVIFVTLMVLMLAADTSVVLEFKESVTFLKEKTIIVAIAIPMLIIIILFFILFLPVICHRPIGLNRLL